MFGYSLRLCLEVTSALEVTCAFIKVRKFVLKLTTNLIYF